MKLRPLRASSTQNTVRQYFEWAKQYGHPQTTGVVEFVAQQRMGHLQALHPKLRSGGDLRSALRGDISAFSKNDVGAAKFMPVFTYRTASGVHYRYSLMLAMAEDGVEWTARVWRGLEYQGMLVGRGQWVRSRHSRLSRMAIEHQLDQPIPDYVEL